MLVPTPDLLRYVGASPEDDDSPRPQSGNEIHIT